MLWCTITTECGTKIIKFIELKNYNTKLLEKMKKKKMIIS